MRAGIAFYVSLFFLPIASSSAQTPTLPPMTRAEQINSAIDMLVNIRTATLQLRQGKEGGTYKLVSARLFQCSMMYALLSKLPQNDVNTRKWHEVSSRVFEDVARVLYTGSSETWRSDMAVVGAEIERLYRQQDRKKTFYLLRNCKDFTEPGSTNVGNAISELSLE
jgi:hypothetical protein